MRRPEPISNVPGLSYIADFLSVIEAAALNAHVAGILEWEHPVFRGVRARRGMACFGWRYVTVGRRLEPAAALPGWLLELREKVAAVLDVDTPRLDQAIVTRYPVGAGIGQHTDAPCFGPTVVGLSLGGQCRMHWSKPGEERQTLVLEPRSLLIMSGAARSCWQHEIPPVRAERVSITLRSVNAWPDVRALRNGDGG